MQKAREEKLVGCSEQKCVKGKEEKRNIWTAYLKAR